MSISLTALTAAVGLIHVGLGAGIVGLTYRTLELSFGGAAVIGLGAATAVILCDWLVGTTVLGLLHPMTWRAVEQLVIGAAAGAAVGLVGFALLFRPEEMADPEEVRIW
jgi:hypothetical protein